MSPLISDFESFFKKLVKLKSLSVLSFFFFLKSLSFIDLVYHFSRISFLSFCSDLSFLLLTLGFYFYFSSSLRYKLRWFEIYLLSSFGLHCMAHGILVPSSGIELGPQQWKHLVLTTGLSRNSSFFFITVNFPLRTVFVVSHKFWYVVQGTTEQHRLELCECTYTQIFFFQWICIALVCNPQWVESVDTEPPHIRRADYKLYPDFWLCGGLMPLNPAFVQGSTVYLFLSVSRYFISLLLWFLHHTTVRYLFLKTFISRWCNTDADNHVTPADAWLGGGLPWC